MKLLLFIIILIIVYFLIMKLFINKKDETIINKPINSIKEITILPNNRKKKIKLVSKKEKTKFMTKDKLIDNIKQKYLCLDYLFNLSNNPSTIRYLTSQFSPLDNKYLKYINKNIMQWNNIYNNDINVLFIDNIQPISVVETDNEFMIKVTAKLLYLDKPFYVKLVYYGLINKMDDFFAKQDCIYHLQLVAIDEISKQSYHKSKEPVTIESTFVTMEEQMKYVHEINKIHEQSN